MNEYTEMDDRTLVEMTLVGKSEAFEELVTRHECAVKRSAYSVTGNAYSAEDASQDAFVAAWMRLDTLDDFARFSPWVCRIAANRAKDLMAKYRRDIPDLSLDLEVLENAVADDEDIAELISLRAGEVQDEKLAAALDALSAKVREVITHHYFDELSVDEIAARLSLPAGTVKWRLSEGRRKLRKEYGKMEKEYNENDALVSRVMYAVEQLKMWRLQANKTGFEEDYREVLALVGELEEGEQKSHAAADVLLMGYWWIDDERNDEVLERIRAEAEKGHNEEVMSAVCLHLFYNKCDRKYAEAELIPYLEKHRFKKAIGRLKLEMAEYMTEKDEKLALLGNALKAFTEKDKHYYVIKRQIGYLEGLEDGEDSINAVEVREIRKIDGVRYYWSNDWSQMTSRGAAANSRIVTPTARFREEVENSRVWGEVEHKAGDRLGCDPDEAPVQDHYVAETDAVVTVPAGTFENCEHIVWEHRYYGGSGFRDDVWFCPGVGPVKYEWRGSSRIYESTWELASYDVCGGGRYPLAKGSRREYVCTYSDPDLDKTEFVNTSEVVYEDGDRTFILFHRKFTIVGENRKTWRGAVIDRRVHSWWTNVGGEWELDIDSDEYFEREKELAANNRERAYSEIMQKHMRHIYETARESNLPGKTKLAYWDPFEPRFLEIKDGDVRFVRGEDIWRGKWYSYEPLPDHRTGYIMVHNSLYQEIDTLIGAIWSDKWTPGYKGSHHTSHWGEEADNMFEVKDGGTVVTPAGTFENCILVEITSENYGIHRYLHGKKKYYYAPGIGIVKFVTYYGGENDESFEKIEFLLTKYDGVGEGYFPIANGLFRRLEPVPMPEGCDISVESTITVDDDAAVFFIDQRATKEIDPGEESKGE